MITNPSIRKEDFLDFVVLVSVTGVEAFDSDKRTVLYRVTQEALASVPDSFREASMGIGATKWQTVLRVVLPSAFMQGC